MLYSQIGKLMKYSFAKQILANQELLFNKFLILCVLEIFMKRWIFTLIDSAQRRMSNVKQ